MATEPHGPGYYRPRSNVVEAWRVPDDKTPEGDAALTECATWLKAERLRGLGLNARINGRKRLIFPGTWVVRTTTGWQLMNDDEFNATYTKEGSR